MANDDNLQFCVIGLGEYGFALARTLAENGAYVLAIDNREERVEEIQFYVSEAVTFDATDPKLLEDHGVTKADIVVVAIGESFEPTVLITMELLKAGVEEVIARANNDTQETILKKIGVKKVIHPERDEGERTAQALMRMAITDYFELAEDLGIYEVVAPDDLIGYKLGDLKLRERYRLNVLTIKRPEEEVDELTPGKSEFDRTEEDSDYEVLGVLNADTEIKHGDKLLLLGSEEAVDKLLETNQ